MLDFRTVPGGCCGERVASPLGAAPAADCGQLPDEPDEGTPRVTCELGAAGVVQLKRDDEDGDGWEEKGSFFPVAIGADGGTGALDALGVLGSGGDGAAEGSLGDALARRQSTHPPSGPMARPCWMQRPRFMPSWAKA